MCDCDVVGLMQTLCTWVWGIVSLMVWVSFFGWLSRGEGGISASEKGHSPCVVSVRPFTCLISGFFPQRGDGGDVGKGGGCGHSHVIRLTGPRPFMQILLIAQRLSLVVASWHFAIPETKRLESGGYRSMIICALCR